MPLASQSSVSTAFATSAATAFKRPNVAGHGLVVVAYCETSAPSPPALSISDSLGNAYLPLATASVLSSSGNQDVLEGWYVSSCAGGTNAVKVQDTNATSPEYIIVAVVEYAAAIAKLDVSAEGASASGSNIRLSLQPSAANKLVLIAGTLEGINLGMWIDPSTPGFMVEASGGFLPGYPPVTVPYMIAADLVSSSAGTQAAQMDFSNADGGSCMIAAALEFATPLGSQGQPQPLPPPLSIQWQQGRLSLAVIPGFFDLGDDCMQGGQPCADDLLLKVSHNAKFAAVRSKFIYMGFYAHGNTVPTPVDPDDGYRYSREECQFVCSIFSNRAPAPGFVPGQTTPPAQSNSQPGTLYNWPGAFDVNDGTGLVSCRNTYWQNGQEIVANDGILKVYASCLRLSINGGN